MLIRSLFTGLATSMLIVSNVAAASQPTANAHLLVVVTNTSHVCQRFEASGAERRIGSVRTPDGQDISYINVPPSLQREAAPGATVTFEGLTGRFSTVWARSHETANCTSQMMGHGYTYSPRAPRVKLTFDGTTFREVQSL